MSRKYKNSKKDVHLKRIDTELATIKEESVLVSFNFKYFISGSGYGESFSDWEKSSFLSDLNSKLVDFSKSKLEDLKQDGTLERYDSFPSDSKFKQPPALKGMLGITWARLRITGERRLIGFLINSQKELFEKEVFYVVFLDKNHQFAPCKKKHT